MCKNRKSQLTQVLDHEGWGHGMSAVLKHVFGTDTEVRVKHGGVHEEVEHAQNAVGRMSKEAEDLLGVLNGGKPQPIDDVEEALEAMVKDL